ncbi:MAG: hydrogenase nickel incorporation protein HypA [Spirochaetales bacterium]|nr:hydrogenase nickel incorporation protein HypA [Spirochaetales bacterium]
MHEWALAEAVVASVDRILEEHQGRALLAVHVRIGELQHIEMDVFREGLRIHLDERPYGIESFHFETEPAGFRCNACGREWLLESVQGLGEDELEAIHFLPEAAHVYLRCPDCGSPDFVLASGRGVGIASVDLEGPD